MNRSWLGPALTIAILGGVGLILFSNREPAPRRVKAARGETLVEAASEAGATDGPLAKPGREYPIGDEQSREHMRIAAVWLESVGMAGMAPPSADIIHIEADIRATADNPNGFGKDEFVPYLDVRYRLATAKDGRTVDSGKLLPMVAADGLHYGANIARPARGRYTLTYEVDPPTANLGRHLDVAGWWKPFSVAFDWEQGTGTSVAGTNE